MCHQAPPTPNQSLREQDLDIILHVEDHDLDFGPDEAVLDNTAEVAFINLLFGLRTHFRRILRRSNGGLL